MNERKYDIGHGVTLVATSSGVRAEWKHGSCSTSIGCGYPPNPPQETRIIWSRSGDVYYVADIADIRGFWLGKAKFSTESEALLAAPAGIFGKKVAQFNDRSYFRIVMDFSAWDVQSSKEECLLSRDDELVSDYAALVIAEFKQAEQRFDEAIAFSGRTLRELLEIIGPWVPVVEDAPLKI